MTVQDAIIYLRQMREEYAGKLALGINPGEHGKWIPVPHRPYYINRIAALDSAVVMLEKVDE